MDKRVLKAVLTAQENEITEHAIYTTLAGHTGDPHNRTVLKTIAEDEMQHYRVWKEITGRDVNPIRWRVGWYVLISRVFGLSFGLKLMERGEAAAQIVYTKLEEEFAELGPLVMDEQKHEQAILSMLEEERLEYAGAIVLGLNDALVELTGALAGLTLALQNGRMIAVIGLITGIAAAMSMASSGYLFSREEKEGNEDQGRSPARSALYTGVTYLLTVAFLILPYMVIQHVFVALGVMIAIAILIIAVYTFYISTAKNLDFWSRFREMAGLSLAVASISFAMGWVVRTSFGVDL